MQEAGAAGDVAVVTNRTSSDTCSNNNSNFRANVALAFHEPVVDGEVAEVDIRTSKPPTYLRARDKLAQAVVGVH